ncbi:sugar ABC transporter ATP-binding protein [Pseudoclavibacter endophyticus]|uniref:sn-glycerol-3-phosphate ABC transporter ATP-binding protein UgpC n=1 Tax=Pseudoclavibacter endophyticus TaxID=1778590 RepID=A0A6H9WDC5_9MICO|nr:sn-glycerol-3-phosphate ABC transporter ATP-binding protein UgpC [Pseudoclavibacter endophyticus]KAB1648952.1 sn-glycerol-3-phosphate ABC transporter ATP-binding protein UgpC [Pseudoclavibacter endophyticus]GGA66813.1 sugar ABC transporter ATP-binding protein [Pseudoclavibacter endophyticus]
MASVTFDRVTLQYPGATRPAVSGLDLEIHDGEFLVLVGPSGCGKSTSLRVLAGLEQVTSGSILIDGEDVTEVDPKDRDIAMVFQNYALYPHMSVAENMGFALKLAKRPSAEIRERVREAAEMLDLVPYLDRRPKALSGGQRQRVAMGRAIVRQPRVFCMDEPLSNLDAKLRVQTRGEIARLQHRLGTTTLYVTHDQVEALTMGDRVAVLKDGVLQQVAAPRELYREPANVFVAGFVGSPAMNLFDGTLDADGAAHLGDLRIPVPSEGLQRGGGVTIGVRPEHVALDSDGPIEATVDMTEELGSDSYVYARAKLPGEPPIIVRVRSQEPPTTGDTIRVAVDTAHVHFFDAVSGERVR